MSVFDEPTANGDPHVLMDSLIHKAYKVVNQKQESKYINEAYFIIGMANYLKGDYYTAIEFFNTLTDPLDEQYEYKPLAYAWKSRAELQLGKVEQAGLSVDSAFMYLDDKKSTRTFVNACKANYLISIEDVTAAIPFLEFALESAPRSPLKDRWTFLLSQLYQEKGETELAYRGFRKIARSNVPFDMAFEASLKAAELEVINGVSVEDRVKPLKKMLKEGKNEGYMDRILYRIGYLYMGEGLHEEAFNYYNKSLREERPSPYQATETYLTMADYYFDHELYSQAQTYYDSVVMVLPTDYTDVDQLRRKLGYMSELTALYKENLWQDTLIQLAAMTDQLREKTLDTFAHVHLDKEVVKWEKNKALALKSGKKRTASRPSSRPTPLLQHLGASSPEEIQTDNRFYFNNRDAMALGSSEFRRKWGNRQLKENWRYAPDETQSLAREVSDEGEGTTEKVVELDKEHIFKTERNRFVQHIPLDERAYDSSYNIIHDNMIVIGNIYREYIQDKEAAIKIQKDFLEKFPNSESRPEVLYSLYRMYEMSDSPEAHRYRQQLIQAHPSSIHAKVALDANYLEKQKREKAVLDRSFERLFDLYVLGRHDRVIEEADKTLQSDFDNASLVSQIRYLKALAVGRIGRTEDFSRELELLITDFPSDSLVIPLAMANLKFMQENPSLFVNRVNALQDIDRNRITFVDEPDMTPWPSLVINGDYRTGIAIASDKKEEIIEKLKVVEDDIEQEVEEIVEVAAIEEKNQRVAITDIQGTGKKTGAQLGELSSIQSELERIELNRGNAKIEFGPNDYRDKSLFPDTGTYYFVINVADHRLNMAPSRYGIGQFLRSRYARERISHQLKEINGENQLIYIGPFQSLEEVKVFEGRIVPLLPDIMKVPDEIYNTFLLTDSVLETLVDGVQIRNYHQVYIEQ